MGGGSGIADGVGGGGWGGGGQGFGKVGVRGWVSVFLPLDSKLLKGRD